MLQFGVAKELGLSLTTVCTTFTPEELLGLERLLQHPERGPAKGNRQSQTPPLTRRLFCCVDCPDRVVTTQWLLRIPQ
jgi:hypothetical protein